MSSTATSWISIILLLLSDIPDCRSACLTQCTTLLIGTALICTSIKVTSMIGIISRRSLRDLVSA